MGFENLLILPQYKAVYCTAGTCQILIVTAHISIPLTENHEKHGVREKVLCYYAICFRSMHVKFIHLADLLQQVNAAFIRDLFEKAFDTFLWLLWPVKPDTFSFNAQPLLPSCFSGGIFILLLGLLLFLVFFSWFAFTWWYIAQLAWTFCPPLRSALHTWLRTVLIPLQGGKVTRWAHPHQDLQSFSSGQFSFISHFLKSNSPHKTAFWQHGSSKSSTENGWEFQQPSDFNSMSVWTEGFTDFATLHLVFREDSGVNYLYEQMQQLFIS